MECYFKENLIERLSNGAECVGKAWELQGPKKKPRGSISQQVGRASWPHLEAPGEKGSRASDSVKSALQISTWEGGTSVSIVLMRKLGLREANYLAEPTASPRSHS